MTTPKYSLAEKQAILEMLLDDRCQNYGYDWKVFRRISNQRSRARQDVKKVIHFGGVAGLYWDTLPSRVVVENGTASYTVGQSSNEEITNILRRLINPNAKWVS